MCWQSIKCSSFFDDVKSWLNIYFLLDFKHKTWNLKSWSGSSSATVVWQCAFSCWRICSFFCSHRNAKYHQYPVTLLQSFHHISILGSLFILVTWTICISCNNTFQNIVYFWISYCISGYICYHKKCLSGTNFCLYLAGCVSLVFCVCLAFVLLLVISVPLLWQKISFCTSYLECVR